MQQAVRHSTSVKPRLAAARCMGSAQREQAAALLPELSLWPVAARGLGITQAKDVQNLVRDPLGLPRLDDVFFAPE